MAKKEEVKKVDVVVEEVKTERVEKKSHPKWEHLDENGCKIRKPKGKPHA